MSGYSHRFRPWHGVVLACLTSGIPLLGVAQERPMTGMQDAPALSQSIPSQTMSSMDMNDSASHAMLLVDQLEWAHGYDGNSAAWEAESWYGNDDNKLWLRTEGEQSGAHIESGDVEAFWNHPVSPFWSMQLGIRHDLGIGPHRDWAAWGIEGLAPYWFELEATAYASSSGRLAARGRAEYTLRFTQRLMLQPEFEINLYSRADPSQYIGRGLSNAELGLRLRYQVTRQFAPYVGLVWARHFGETAGFVRAERQPVFDRQIVVGIRFWM